MPNNYHYFQNKIEGKANQIYDYAPVIDSTGDLKRLEGIDVVILSIRTLLLTPLGHYPFDPEYGSLLYKKIFEMADGTTLDEIEYEVRERVRKYETRAKIQNIDVHYTFDRKTVIVNIEILKGDIPGTVSLRFNSNSRMFGLEDDITAGLS